MNVRVGIRDAALGLFLAGILAGCNGGVSRSPLLPPGATSNVALSGSGVSPAAESVLYRFKGLSAGDGAYPESELLLDGSAFFGTTYEGGEASGLGTIFKVSDSGAESVLHRFEGGTDGALPEAGLISGSGGVLYGATEYGGGACSGYFSSGCGTIFELIPSGKGYAEHVIYAFKGGDDGAFPAVSLVLGKGGVIFGTTTQGGGSSACPDPSGPTGCGTVFKLTPKGTGFIEKVLHRFAAGTDGAIPGGLVLYRDVLYGTTEYGGYTTCSGGCGMIYSITTNGHEKLLYKFHVASGSTGDGIMPTSALLPGKAGTFYGVTLFGGTAGDGTAYKFDISGSKPEEQVIHSFPSSASDGSYPEDLDGLRIDSAGKLYGTTRLGGTSKSCPGGCGTLFELSPPAKGSHFSETILHSFNGGSDGINPFASPTLDSNGSLWGTAVYGGSKKCSTTSGIVGCGIIYKISP
jgi:uncharacterized repeat protein (TIGR03803 family)